MIKALLFDFDGTLVDTESICLRAWEDTYRRHGVELSFERWQQGIGTIDGFDEVGHLEELLGRQVHRDTVNEEHRARELAMLAEEPLRPGVAEYLDEANRLRLAVAIVSSSSRKWIETSLVPLARMDGWACMSCAEGDAERAKPRPTLYLEALDAVAARAEEAIAFEDSPNGVTAARAAGIFCVAIPNSVTERLDVTHADLVVASLDELPLTRLLELVEARAA